MKYIVSAENKPYFYWQLELLIESFKRHGQESNLIIGLAETDTPAVFPINMKGVDIILHQNLGQQMNYSPVNKWIAVWAAMKSGRIKPEDQFCLIDPDMVMVRPINETSECRFIAQETHMMVLDHIEENNCPIRHHLEAMNRLEFWLPIGLVYVMQWIEEAYPLRVIQWCHDLIVEQGKAVGTRWWPTEMVATNLAMVEAGHVAESRKDYCCILSDPAEANFIHYYGPLHLFDKHRWKDATGNQLLMEPINALLSIDPAASSSVEYLRGVCESYLKTIGVKQ